VVTLLIFGNQKYPLSITIKKRGGVQPEGI